MSVLALLFLFCVAPAKSQNLGDFTSEEYHFKSGEELDFRLSYGWFTVGRAQASINAGLVEFNGKACYQVEVSGTTSGLLGVFTDVNDHWGAYIDGKNLKPVHAYKQLQEGNYERIAKTDFMFEEGIATVEKWNPKKEIRKPIDTFDISQKDRDFLSAYLNLRNIKFENLIIGDSIEVNAFYEREFYPIILEYGGKELLRSKVGKIEAHKLFVVMEPNDIFPDERGIVAYVSADKNHLPLRIEAEMFFGKAYCDLVAYRNVKYGPDFQ
ncbi:MAG: DUF3108 domain-containing protein [Cyclobacteriaceae bacterium]